MIDYVDEYGINHGVGVKIDGTVWAPVNCGYHATDFKYGKLYQWGRKYGQGYSGDLYNDWNKIGETSDATVPEFSEGGVSETAGNHNSNSNVFYTGPTDWIDPQNDKLWNNGSESFPVRTESDPCPEGWRVPTYAELNELNQNHSLWTTNAAGQPGYWFSGASSYTEGAPQVFFPAAGSRDYSGNASYRGLGGFYWSSVSYYGDYNYSYSLYFHNGHVNLCNDSRAFGFSVRCVQEQ